MKRILFISIGPQTDIVKSLREVGIVWQYDWTGLTSEEFNRDVILLSEMNDFDIVFMQIQHPGIITVETAKRLSEKSYVVNWTGDVRSPLPEWYKEIGGFIDLTLFSNMNDLYEMWGLRLKADYLDIGFPDEIFVPDGDRYTDHPPIVFMGQNTGNAFPLSRYRCDMVDFLTNRFGSLFRLYGHGWYGGDVRPITDQNEEAKIYRSCKVAINLSHFDYEKYSSDRIYRIMGSGCLCLSHRYKGVEEQFKEHEYIELWRNFDELSDLIDNALNSPIRAMRTGSLAAHNVHINHTWRNRVAQLMNLIRLYPKK